MSNPATNPDSFGVGDTPIIDISGDMIRLGQFLKFANFADSGAHAGAMVADGDVSVDGQIETRRGRQLAKGMLIEVRTPDQVLAAKVG